MEDFISADPCTFDHASLFKLLQNLTLEYRLNDPYCSLVNIYFLFYVVLFVCCIQVYTFPIRKKNMSSMDEESHGVAVHTEIFYNME